MGAVDVIPKREGGTLPLIDVADGTITAQPVP
jgi:hypothetical protein